MPKIEVKYRVYHTGSLLAAPEMSETGLMPEAEGDRRRGLRS